METCVSIVRDDGEWHGAHANQLLSEGWRIRETIALQSAVVFVLERMKDSQL